MEMADESKVIDDDKVADTKLGDETPAVTDEEGIDFALDLGKIDAEVADAHLAMKLTSTIVPTTDDPTAPGLSFRAWVLGTFWCACISIPNAILAFRTNSITVDSTLATLLGYPMGLAMAASIPAWTFKIGSFSFSTNPGPFTLKEHALISIMANAGTQGVYGVYNMVGQRWDRSGYMGNENVTFVASLFWCLSTNMIGYGIAGLARRFLVKPAAMLWPSTLGSIGLFVSLHKPDLQVGRWKMTRFNFFWIAVAVVFVYELIPNILAPAIQSVALLCLFSQDSVSRFLGSAQYPNGPGLLALTFDWQYIGSSALTTPWIYQVNFYLGCWVQSFLVGVGLYYSNPFKHPQLKTAEDDYIPNTNETYPVFNSVGLFKNDGLQFSARSLYDADYNLNVTKYNEYAPVYITDFFALAYLSDFLVLPCMVTHVCLWYGKDILRQLKSAVKQMDDSVDSLDIHNKLMKAYKEVPDWVYGAWLLLWTIVLIIIGQTTAYYIPWWAVLLAVVISTILIIPIGIVFAITGTQIYLNVLQEFIAGLLLVGQTVPVMCWKSIGVTTAQQANQLLGDLKIGHYLKVPPVHMFIAQIWGTTLSTILYVALTWWMMFQTAIDVGGDDQEWRATGFLTFANAGAIWGAIGPSRFFGIGSVYVGLLWGFLIGGVSPIIPYVANRIFPSAYWHYINLPLFFYIGAAGSMQNFYFIPPIVGFIFQYVLLNKATDWWKKYNYVLAAAISGGVAAAVMFTTGLNGGNYYFPTWALNPETNLEYYCWGDSYAYE